MTASELLTQATAEGITLTLAADQISAAGPRHLLTQWAPLLREHKAPLLDLLRAANDPAPPSAWLEGLPPDDRIQCTACRNLTGAICQAARRREFGFRAPWYEPPDTERLHACYGFLPVCDDPDQRPGAVRWPSLAWMARS